jgi:sarcosine oxidase subunit beta
LKLQKGFIKTKKVGVVAAGHSSVIANMAGLRLPLESKPLQALVSEPVKPIIDTVVMSNAVHAYVSQSDKGELVIGAGLMIMFHIPKKVVIKLLREHLMQF